MNQVGIVYCCFRKDCEDLFNALLREEIITQYYHAGLSPNERKQIQENWTKGDFKIIIATIAFGMGIDKPDVRFVIHKDMPRCLNDYIQETGRVGRDGLTSNCLMLYDP